MTTFFLGCFAFGVIFTVASFALGAFGDGHGLHIPGLGGLHGHGGDLGGVGHDGGIGHHGGAGHGAHLSPFNLSTISAFLAWFGGAGYLLSRYSDLAAASVLLLAGAAGAAGGGIIFLTLTRLVLPRLTDMRPEDFQLVGAVARVSVGIRAGGVGEIAYSLGVGRQLTAARSAGGDAIPEGTEVLVARVEGGVACVERWDKFAAKHELPPGESGAK